MVSRARTACVTTLAAVAWFGTACGERTAGPDEIPAPINAENLDQRIRVLAADSMEGRAPASDGEERTVAYLEREFRRVGLEPANGDRYTQEVPLVSLTTDPAAARFTVRGDGGTSRLTYGPEYMAWTTRVVGSTTGMTTRASMSRERRLSCLSTIRASPPRIPTSSPARR
jgi:hypothetical protein